MRAVRVTSFVVITLGFFLISNGCGNKEEPFKEWWAAERYENFVPPDAEIVGEGTGELRYTAPSNGTLYLLDLSDMRMVKNMSTPHVVATGAPLPGNEIIFDPKTATLSSAGKKPLKLTKVVPGHKFQLRWKAEKS
jgi:hypothetical protein